MPEAASAMVARKEFASAGYFSIVGPDGGGRGAHGVCAMAVDAIAMHPNNGTRIQRVFIPTSLDWNGPNSTRRTPRQAKINTTL